MGWMVLSVGLDGALGAISRYLIGLCVTGSFGQSGWMAILSVNVAGSLIMGMMAALLTVSSLFSDPVHEFVMIGFLGAFTAFPALLLTHTTFSSVVRCSLAGFTCYRLFVCLLRGSMLGKWLFV